MSDVIRHGMRSTYNRGCRCDACKDASRRYQAELRARTPQFRARGRALSTAYGRALRELRLRHPAEFDELYRAALEVAMAEYHPGDAS